jgi:pimeloyl-ACP methyl ester carboxylesterase
MLAFERLGSGPPLVLLHGVGHRRQAWYPVRDQLAEQRDLILVDLPGHGESGPLELAGRLLVEVLTSSFREVLSELGLDKAHVAGNSLGGRIALEAGVAGDALSVTALSPAGFWRSTKDFAYTKGLFGTVSKLSGRLEPRAERLSQTKAGRTTMLGWITAHPGNIEPEQALGDFKAFRRAQPVLHEIIAAATRFEGVIPPQIPVTIAWGTRDLVLPRYQAKVARQSLPQARHLWLTGSGHVPMSDDPQTVAQILLEGSSVPTEWASGQLQSEWAVANAHSMAKLPTRRAH